MKAEKEFEKNEDGGNRDPLDEEESRFSLSLITKKLITEPKIVNNSRIVVVNRIKNFINNKGWSF
jgi:hypothetical protein